MSLCVFSPLHQSRCFTLAIVYLFHDGNDYVNGPCTSYKQFQLFTSQANISKPKSETTTIEAENTNIEISQTA
jgi:hypothetical protein